MRKGILKKYVDQYFSELEQVGEGAASHVHSGLIIKSIFDLEPGQRIAIKSPKSTRETDLKKRFERERDFLKIIKDQRIRTGEENFIVDYYGEIPTDDGFPILITELATGHDIDYLRELRYPQGFPGIFLWERKYPTGDFC